MIEAITYEAMKRHLIDKYKGHNKTFAIILVKPNKSFVSEEILNNITYFHHRSEEKLDIFLPGYGAYWGSEVPDSKNVCKVESTDWSFSTKYFVKFINDIELNSKIKYRGGSELILLDFKGNDVCFSNVVRVKLDAALRDKAIDSVEEFIEKVISLFIKTATAYNISDTLTLNEFGKSIADELKNRFVLYRLFTRTRHYTISNYEK